MAKWIWAGALLLALAGCGGGFGKDADPDPSPTPTPTPTGDVRNGVYTAFVANGREYALNLDFDSRRFRITGNGLDQSGAIANVAGDSAFSFVPTGSAIPCLNTARFFQSSDTVIGGFRFAEGVLPFIAQRSFFSRLPDAVGVYNVLARGVDTAAATTATTAVFQAEVTAGGQLQTCDNLVVSSIADCPPGSVTSGNVTLNGDIFTSAPPGGAFVFRIARIGGEKLLLRANPSSGTARVFWVGLPATTTFAAGSFGGATTDGNFSSLTVSATAHTATFATPSGTTVVRSGDSHAAGSGGLGGLLSLTTRSSGSFYAARAAELAVVVSTPGSATPTGSMEIGKRQ